MLVNKALPQNLTLWNNGIAEYVGIPVNSGAPGADTTDGTFAVFEHVRFSDMKGTNPDGTTYNDPNVPYASYFNGGDACCTASSGPRTARRRATAASR